MKMLNNMLITLDTKKSQISPPNWKCLHVNWSKNVQTVRFIQRCTRYFNAIFQSKQYIDSTINKKK